METEVIKAELSDLKDVVEFVFSGSKTIQTFDGNFFEEVFSQSGYNLLVAKKGEEIIGILAVSVINGIGEKYPVAVLTGGKLNKDGRENKAGDLLIEKAKEIAKENNCKSML